jgi:hypothetical protein
MPAAGWVVFLAHVKGAFYGLIEFFDPGRIARAHQPHKPVPRNSKDVV